MCFHQTVLLVFQVDIASFEEEMSKQRQRSKDSAKTVDLEVGGVLAQLASQMEATKFNGYTEMEGRGTVMALLRDGTSVDSIDAGACIFCPLPGIYSL